MEHRAQRVQVVLAMIVLFNIVFALGYGAGSYPLICCITSLLTAAVALFGFVWLSALIDEWNQKLFELKRDLELK